MSYMKIGGASGGSGLTEVATFADLPVAGGEGLFLAQDTRTVYWWSGSTWGIVYGLLDDSFMTGNGIVARTGSRAYSPRTITGTAGRLTVANGDGVAGNPTLNLDTGLIPAPLLADVGKMLRATGAGTAAWSIPKFSELTAETGGASSGAGSPGEVIETIVTVATVTGVGLTGEWGDVALLDLPAGSWEIEAVAGMFGNGANLAGALVCGISDTAGNTAPGVGSRCAYPFLISGTAAELLTPRVLANFAGANKNYYLKTQFTYSAGSPQHYGRIRARRKA